MKLLESYAVILKADHEQFRITLLDEHMGKVRALFFGVTSPGMVVRVTLNTKTQMPTASLVEIVSSPIELARADIWWFHSVLALINASVPLGSGMGPLYEQVFWLCRRDIPLDNQLQMRYCAKIITTLGLQRVMDQLCTLCMHSLQVTSVDKLKGISLDSECSLRLTKWVTGSIEEQVGSFFVPYTQIKDC